MADWGDEDDLHLQSYRGSYDYRSLSTAASELFNNVERSSSPAWRKIKEKTGIFRQRSSSFGRHSTYYSQADLPWNNSFEGSLTSPISNEISGPSSRGTQVSRKDKSKSSARTATVTKDSSSLRENSISSSRKSASNEKSDEPAKNTLKDDSSIKSPDSADLFILDYTGNRQQATPVPSVSETPSSSNLVSSIHTNTEKKDPNESSDTIDEDKNDTGVVVDISSGSELEINDTGIVIDVSSGSDLEIIAVESKETEVIEIEDSEIPDNSNGELDDGNGKRSINNTKSQLSDRTKGNIDSTVLICDSCSLRFADKHSFKKHQDLMKRRGSCSLKRSLSVDKKIKETSTSTACARESDSVSNVSINETQNSLQPNLNAKGESLSDNKRKLGMEKSNEPAPKKRKTLETLEVTVTLDTSNEQKLDQNPNRESTSTRKIEVQPVNGSDAGVTPESGGLSSKRGYKCDYCAIVIDSVKGMMEHMQQQTHASASLVTVDDNNVPVNLLIPSKLFEENLLWKKAVIICPQKNCLQFFTTPSDCMQHQEMCYSNSPNYCVADIKLSELFSCDRRYCNKCYKCLYVFSRPSELYSHQESERHYPYTRGVENTITLFRCYCKKTSQTYKDMLFHFTSKCRKHRAYKRPEKQTVTVMHINRNFKKVPYEPFPAGKVGEMQSLKTQVVSLKGLKGGLGKNAKKRINQELAKVKQLMKSWN